MRREHKIVDDGVSYHKYRIKTQNHTTHTSKSEISTANRSMIVHSILIGSVGIILRLIVEKLPVAHGARILNVNPFFQAVVVEHVVTHRFPDLTIFFKKIIYS